MARGKGNLSNALAKHQHESIQKKIKLQKLKNKNLHYPTNGKKPNFKSKQQPSPSPSSPLELPPLNKNKTFIPFNENDRILIVGDGDFSYSLSIIEQKLIKPEKVIITSFDSLNMLYDKYGNELIDSNIAKLKNLGVLRIYHEIDGTKLNESLNLSIGNKKSGNGSGKSIEVLGGLKINNIVFNFPHIGKHIKDVTRNIAKNQELLFQFFKSCKEFYQLLKHQRDNFKGDSIEEKLETKKGGKDAEDDDQFADIDDLSSGYYGFSNKNRGGDDDDDDIEKVTITLFDGEPYDSWKVKKIARDSIGYSVERSGKFEWRYFAGYQHRRTAGLGSTNKLASSRNARIYKFERFDYNKHSKSKRPKHGHGGSGADDGDDDGDDGDDGE